MYKTDSLAQAERTMGNLASLAAALWTFCNSRENLSSDTDLQGIHSKKWLKIVLYSVILVIANQNTQNQNGSR